jgi:8-oxo-dGTP pyrophosphatase MutT (NUDIX family)
MHSHPVADEQVSSWEIEEAARLHENAVFSVYRRRMRRSQGGKSAADFFVIDSPSWVNIVALTPDDRLVLIEQWRHAVQHRTLEIPGGGIDQGEPPLEAAKRELIEETGFSSSEWFDLGCIEPNPAIIDNRCYMFLAMNSARVEEPAFDNNEECRLVLHPYVDVDTLVSSGRISHALVLVALYFEKLRRAGLHPAPRV